MYKVIEVKLLTNKDVIIELPIGYKVLGLTCKDNIPTALFQTIVEQTILTQITLKTVISNEPFGEIGKEYRYVGNFNILARRPGTEMPEPKSLYVFQVEVVDASSKAGNEIILSK